MPSSARSSAMTVALRQPMMPRMRVLHTASHEAGQIYMPAVNWMLAAGTIGAVITFGSSDALGGAYGIAVSLLMALLYFPYPPAHRRMSDAGRELHELSSLLGWESCIGVAMLGAYFDESYEHDPASGHAILSSPH